ncbi:hypothetical protein DYD21_07090 [Rhodohalobacter sp. SW132]|nr:hypothetical protein DYD21_07090 [Rhodohalobacter sp. SW132]
MGLQRLSKKILPGYDPLNKLTEALYEKTSTTLDPLINICEQPSDIIPNPSLMHRPMARIYCHIISPGSARLHRASPGAMHVWPFQGRFLNIAMVDGQPLPGYKHLSPLVHVSKKSNVGQTMIEDQSKVSRVIYFVPYNLPRFMVGYIIQPRTGRKSTARGCKPRENVGYQKQEPRGDEFRRINDPHREVDRITHHRIESVDQSL